jgi:chaperonin GroES
MKVSRPAMNVRPLHDRIIVQRLEESEQRAGAIIIPDSANEGKR